jgi:hypothetical protein
VCRAQQLQRGGGREARDPAVGGREVEQVGPGWDAGLGGREEGAAGGALVEQ